MSLRTPRITSAVMSLLLAAASVAAAQQTLVLDNGDRLTGQLAGVAGGVWTFKHAGGEVKIPATTVTGFTTANPIGFRLDDGTIAAGTVAQAGGQLQLTLLDGSTRTIPPPALAAVGDPSALDALIPVQVGYFTPIGMFWGATASFGFSDKSGNSRSRGLAADLQVTRRSPKDRLRFRAGLAREDSRLDPGAEFTRVVEKYYGSARADVFFGPRFFLFGETRQERDTFQDIDLRSIYNAGFGYQVLTTPLTDLRFYSAGGARREDFASDTPSRTVGVLTVGSDLRQKLGPAVFDWTVDWGPSVKDFQDYRLRSDASLTTTVLKGVGFRIGVLNELNNRPPVGVKKHDMLVTTSLTYTIGG